MLSQAREMGTNNHLLWAILFWIGMILLYFSSTLNHALPIGSKGKDFFHNFDQISIYFFIAGTFTPLCLIALDGVRKWGWLLGEWGLAIIGILFKSFRRTDFENGVKNFILISYAIMGSMMFFLIFPLSEIVTTSCIILLCIWCILYGAWVIAFKLERLKYAHLVRHLVVLWGSFIHFFAISHYILPLELI